MKLWRTLIRVRAVDPNEILLVLPGWDHRLPVPVDPGIIPWPVEVGQRLHARVNLEARLPRELEFSDWEPK
jgi:hypothetical protein